MSLFATLKKGELSDFGKFLRKHYSDEKVPLEVFRYFKQLHADSVANTPIDLDLAAQQIAKSGVVRGHFDRKRLHDTFHDLYGMLKHFLLLKKLGDDSLESEAFWLKVQKERGLKAEFEKGANQLLNKVRAAPKQDEEDYLRALIVAFLDYNGHIDNKPPSLAKLTDYANALEVFYQISRLKTCCEDLNQGKIRGGRARGEGLFAQEGLSGEQLYTVYRLVNSLLKNENDTDFAQVTEQLATSNAQLSVAEQRSVSSYLQNFCAGKIRQGRQEYSVLSFEIFKTGLKQGLYFNTLGEISLDTYYNAISAGVAAGEVAQAAQFFQDAMPYIPAAVSEEVALLSKAKLFFCERHYAKATVELQKLENLKVHFFSAVRCRLLKIACMVGQEELDVLQEIINCKNFLARNVTVHANTRKAANNFLDIVNMICRRRKSAENIRVEIGAAKELLYVPWLLEQLKDYKPIITK